MISVNWHPSERELRLFAGIWFPAFWLVVGAILGTRELVSWSIIFAVWGVVAIAGAIGLAWPRLMRPIFVGWMCAAYPIGWVMSHVLLAAVFYLAITPLGLVARALGRDKLKLTFEHRGPEPRGPEPRGSEHQAPDHQAATYWEKRPPAPARERYFRQF